MRRTFVDATVTAIDFMPKMQKVKDSRIMDLRWAAGNTLKADCERLRRAWLSVIASKWSWLGETAALWSRLSPSLDTSHIVPPTTTPLSSFHPEIATARPLRNLTPRLLAAPPQAPANLSPHLWVSIWKVRRDRRGGPGWAVVKYWHGNRYDCGAVRLQRDQTPTFLLPLPRILTVHVCLFRPLFHSFPVSVFYFPL